MAAGRARRPERLVIDRPLTASMVAAVAVGGAAGAVLRWALGTAVPDGAGFPWTTFGINVVGSLLLAVLPAFVAGRSLLTLALGPGVLGGFTTLSAYSEQVRSLLADGDLVVAAAYLFGTLAACLVAVHLGDRFTTAAQRRVFADQEGDE